MATGRELEISPNPYARLGITRRNCRLVCAQTGRHRTGRQGQPARRRSSGHILLWNCTLSRKPRRLLRSHCQTACNSPRRLVGASRSPKQSAINGGSRRGWCSAHSCSNRFAKPRTAISDRTLLLRSNSARKKKDLPCSATFRTLALVIHASPGGLLRRPAARSPGSRKDCLGRHCWQNFSVDREDPSLQCMILPVRGHVKFNRN
jgi:hypothetical protein